MMTNAELSAAIEFVVDHITTCGSEVKQLMLGHLAALLDIQRLRAGVITQAAVMFND